MKVIRNGIEIEYNEALLAKIREAQGKPADAVITEEEIIAFFSTSFEDAIGKGVIEE